MMLFGNNGLSAYNDYLTENTKLILCSEKRSKWNTTTGLKYDAIAQNWTDIWIAFLLQESIESK